MSYMSRPEALEPETLADIKARHAEGDPGCECGCDMTRDRWLICDYHEGFNDAIDQQRRKARQIDESAVAASGDAEPSGDTATPEIEQERPRDTQTFRQFWAALDAGTIERNPRSEP